MARLKFLFVLLLAFCCSCIGSAPEMPARPATQYQIGVARKSGEINISVDADFTPTEQMIIQKAFDDWEVASERKIHFHPKWDQPKPGPYADYEIPYEDSGVFLWYLPKNEEYLSSFFLATWKGFMGLNVYGHGENSGNIIIFDNTKEEYLYSVVTHEIGHFLGLKHIEVRGAIMHPTDLENCLTYADVKQLCDLYGCNPVSQCSLETEFRVTNTLNLSSWELSSAFSRPIPVPLKLPHVFHSVSEPGVSPDERARERHPGLSQDEHPNDLNAPAE